MKPASQEDTRRIDVSCEELEALLTEVRPVLGEAGYQKLQAAIRTLSYVTELLETREATLERLRRLLCHSSTEKTQKVLKQAGIETGEKKEKAVYVVNPSGSDDSRVVADLHLVHQSRGAQGRGSACVLKGWRPVSGLPARESLFGERARRVGADQRAGAHRRDGV